MELIIKNPNGDGTVATLTNEQFVLVELIIVDLMNASFAAKKTNGAMAVKKAEAAIIKKLEDEDNPLVFV